MIRRPPRSTLLPTTALSRSARESARREPPFVLDSGRSLPANGKQRLSLPGGCGTLEPPPGDRKSTRLNSSHANISYAVFCLKKKLKSTQSRTRTYVTVHHF